MEFPRDHYNHPDKKVEWWYYAGIGHCADDLETPINYHIAFFRKTSRLLRDDIHFAHFGFVRNGQHHFWLKRADWNVRSEISDKTLMFGIGSWQMTGFAKRYVVEMDDATLCHIAFKRPAVHHDGYYSITDMDVQGAIQGEPFHGKGWMDHEFKDESTAKLITSQYTWVAIQLDAGVEIMLYMRPKEPTTSRGSIIFPGGVVQPINPGEYCLAEISAGWTLTLPRYGISLDLEKISEMEVKGQLGADYIEGALRVSSRGKRGQGFYEITTGGLL